MKKSARLEATIRANEKQIADREGDYLQHQKRLCRCPKDNNYRCFGHQRACLSTIRLIKEANYKLGQERLRAISLEKQNDNASEICRPKQPKLRKRGKVSRTSNQNG